jgi:hypothetical protein
MKDKFDVHAWRNKQHLKEGVESLDMATIQEIYKFLLKRLDKPAREAGLRMSIFEQEFPLTSSFYQELKKLK